MACGIQFDRTPDTKRSLITSNKIISRSLVYNFRSEAAVSGYHGNVIPSPALD